MLNHRISQERRSTSISTFIALLLVLFEWKGARGPLAGVGGHREPLSPTDLLGSGLLRSHSVTHSVVGFLSVICCFFGANDSKLLMAVKS